MLPEENTNGHTLISFSDARRLLGVSRVTMYKIVDHRLELPVIKTGYLGKLRIRYFYKSDVEALQIRRNPQID